MNTGIQLPRVGSVAAFRRALRTLIAAQVSPADVVWSMDGATVGDLFGDAFPHSASPSPPVALPRDAARSITTALHHGASDRWALAHSAISDLRARRLFWPDRAEPRVRRLLLMEKAVRRDIHKMHAFVRFREVGQPGAVRRAFVAWFEPSHNTVELAAPFFARRFGDMDWIIATPGLTARFHDGRLAIEESTNTAAPGADDAEELWRVYYASIFNPARLKTRTMQSQMPKKYWKNLPEATLIPELVRAAPGRVAAMQDQASRIAAPPGVTPRMAALARARRAATDRPASGLRAEALACTRCALHGPATQTVWGEGDGSSRIMLVGEQPGDREDLTGRPFVGPAGKVLDQALAAAGLVRASLYLTNAVKHFRFQPRGKARLHKRPDAGHVEACRWWLDIERAHMRPALVVALGQTAAEALLRRPGPHPRGTQSVTEDGFLCLVTWHPAHALRVGTDGSRIMAELVADLKAARRFAADAPGGAYLARDVTDRENFAASGSGSGA
ncbi:MAG: UdgX family uracil-DNA binding protein [Gemmobacter sp.]